MKIKRNIKIDLKKCLNKKQKLSFNEIKAFKKTFFFSENIIEGK
jgi:hypothetical protein